MDKPKTETGLQRIAILIPLELHYHTRITALNKRITMSAVVIEALQRYVADHQAARQADVRTFSGKE